MVRATTRLAKLALFRASGTFAYGFEDATASVLAAIGISPIGPSHAIVCSYSASFGGPQAAKITISSIGCQRN